MPDNSITHWIKEAGNGNDDAIRELWERYFSRLVKLARTRLSNVNTRVRDEEDVALSVFERFRTSAKLGRFPDLNDRNSLWQLLAKMTTDKTVDLQRQQNTIKRGAGQVRGESAVGPRTAENPTIDHFPDNEPTPESLAILSERITSLLDLLQRDDLREIAVSKMEGYSNKEIAEKLRCSVRTVERRVNLIRARCEEECVS